MAARRLQALTATARAPAETLVRFRAAQAAFLSYGLLLQLDPAMLATVEPQHGRLTLDAQMTARLRGCCMPQRAAAATLALATGATATDLSRLNVGDLTPDGATIDLAGEPFTVPERARSLVRALLLQRADQHATPAAALFVNHKGGRASPDMLRRLLDQTAALAGVAIPSSYGSWRPSAWLVEHGLTVSRLAAPPPNLRPQ
jgi:integrase